MAHFAQGYSTLFITASATILGTALYVTYKDITRYDRIMNRFAKGNILEPLTEDYYQVTYYPRQQPERHLQDLLKSEVSNQYYFVFGEVGTGKTRLITEVVRKYIRERGQHSLGAPIYILASQGGSFPDTFGAAVDFNYDEHISFKFLLDYIFRVGELPKRDDQTKLERVLSAIEIAAYKYLKMYRRPAVIVIDGVNWLVEVQPGALERLQEKAKLWADTNIVKMVFVSNDEDTEAILQRNHSAWSRGAIPLFIGDLSDAEAAEFLLLPDPIIHAIHSHCSDVTMPADHVTKVVSLVGGRIQHLLLCKLEWAEGKPFEETRNHLRLKERAKFFECMQSAAQYNVVQFVWNAKGREILLKELVKKTDRHSVMELAKHNIFKIERAQPGLMVRFQSRLTEVVVAEMLLERLPLVSPIDTSQGKEGSKIFALGRLMSFLQ